MVTAVPVNVEWQAIESAPKDGRTIEAMSHDFGKPVSTTLYRARFFEGKWLNAEDPREELIYLFEWRDAPARAGIAELFDRLPIDTLAGRIQRGQMVELLHKIAMLRASGQDEAANQAIQHLAGAVAAATR